MKSRFILCTFFVPLVVACASTKASKPYPREDSIAAYDAQNASLALELFGVAFGANARTESQANFSGIHTSDRLFSRRTDSRTYFYYDRYASQQTEGLTYRSGGAELIQISMTLLRRVGVPASEIAQPRVLQEEGQVAMVDPRSVVTNVKSMRLRQMVLISRQIDGVPVFSSRLLLTASAEGRPAFVELHWPEIPNGIVAEARRLQRLVREGWKAPAQKGARVETIEAGIVHSPAAAWVMDIMPVIRVVYTSTSPEVGMKALLYFDRSGLIVAPPREFPLTVASCPAQSRDQNP